MCRRYQLCDNSGGLKPRGIMQPRAFIIAAVISIATSLSGRCEALTPCAEIAASTSTSLLAFYPSAALAAHVGGHAVLKCGRTEHDVMTGCQLVSESPLGQGFGAAALAIAARSKEAPSATISPSQRGPRNVTFGFRPDPCMWPNVIDMPWTPVAPTFARYPDFRQIDQAWAAAQAVAGPVLGRGSWGLGGNAVLSCKADAGGRLIHCTAVDESPAGSGFAKAAMLLAANMVLRPTTTDGVPLADHTITVRVPFWRPRAVGMQ
jgi:hypothetical protein